MTDDSDLRLDELSHLTPAFFEEDNVDVVAQQLVGTILIFDNGEAGPIGGSIVETEAYDDRDPAAHCYKDAEHVPKKGSEAMLLPGGHAYIFTASYGYCLNFVTGRADVGSAVLIRALRPLVGKRIMRLRRGPYCHAATTIEALLCHSPVSLCESLGVSHYQNRASLFEPPFRLYARQSVPELVSGSRVRVDQTIKRLRPALIGSDSANNAVESKRRWVDKNLIEFVKEPIA